ncbi:unnamed protein product, partial [Prorocentrum cordatum]
AAAQELTLAEAAAQSAAPARRRAAPARRVAAVASAPRRDKRASLAMMNPESAEALGAQKIALGARYVEEAGGSSSAPRGRRQALKAQAEEAEDENHEEDVEVSWVNDDADDEPVDRAGLLHEIHAAHHRCRMHWEQLETQQPREPPGEPPPRVGLLPGPAEDKRRIADLTELLCEDG